MVNPPGPPHYLMPADFSSAALAAAVPLGGARTCVSTNAVIVDNLGTDANRTLRRSRIRLDGSASPGGFLRLKVER